MSLGNFSETNENTDNTESNVESNENLDDFESTEDRNEDVDSKIDEHESSDDVDDEKGDKIPENESPWERIKSFLGRANGEAKNEQASESSDSPQEDRAKSFRDSLKEGAPSLEEQAEAAKQLGKNEAKKTEGTDSANDEARTPGGDAWERRFGKIERE